MAPGTPVDDPVRSVDETLFVEGHEDLADCDAQPFVEGEALARPVGRVTELAHLPGDDVPGFRLPLPDPLDECIAADVVAREAFLPELTLDDVLRCDAGVIGAGQPESRVPLHALASDDHVLDGVVQSVSHVEDTGDVRRWDDDAVRLAVGVHLRTKGSGILPYRVPARLDLFGLIGGVHHGLHSRGSPAPAVYRRQKPGEPSPGICLPNNRETERKPPLLAPAHSPFPPLPEPHRAVEQHMTTVRGDTTAHKAHTGGHPPD